MCPKYIILHRFELGKLRDEHKVVYVNPRRVDYFTPARRPTAQPTLDCGTVVRFGAREMVVHESVSEIEKMLKR